MNTHTQTKTVNIVMFIIATILGIISYKIAKKLTFTLSYRLEERFGSMGRSFALPIALFLYYTFLINCLVIIYSIIASLTNHYTSTEPGVWSYALMGISFMQILIIGVYVKMMKNGSLKLLALYVAYIFILPFLLNAIITSVVLFFSDFQVDTLNIDLMGSLGLVVALFTQPFFFMMYVIYKDKEVKELYKQQFSPAC